MYCIEEGALWQRSWCPSVENRDGCGSLGRGGATVGQPPIIDFLGKNPLEGYRRLTFMMLDVDVVAVSLASVWRVLKQAGLLSRWKARRRATEPALSSRFSPINIGI